MKNVTIIGGSVSRAFGLDAMKEDWPTILHSRLKDLGGLERANSIGFLNPAKLESVLSTVTSTDILVIHMGTSVGWPVIRAPLERLLRPSNRHDAAFHLPASPSKNIRHSIARVFRHTLRNTLKIIAFPLGLYRPRQSLRTLEQDLAKALEVAYFISEDVVWIQHRSLGYRRLLLERIVYGLYLKRIQRFLLRESGICPRLHLVDIPDDFLHQGNFTLDGVHLSHQGHQELAHLIEQTLRDKSLLTAKE